MAFKPGKRVKNQGSGAFLDFIDDDKRILGDDIHACMGRQCADDPLDVVVRLKDRFCHGILVQVDVGDAFVFLYETATQVVSRISLVSYHTNYDESTSKINKNSDESSSQIYINSDEYRIGSATNLSSICGKTMC